MHIQNGGIICMVELGVDDGPRVWSLPLSQLQVPSSQIPVFSMSSEV